MNLERGQVWEVHLEGDVHSYVIASEERFNRGNYAIVAPITSKRVDERSKLPNCVPLSAGTAGLTRDSVIQGENVTLVKKSEFFQDATQRGNLDGESQVSLIKAIGYVIGGDCYPL